MSVGLEQKLEMEQQAETGRQSGVRSEPWCLNVGGATWPQVSRDPRSHMIREHMTLCHSCLELSQPQPHLSSMVTLTSSYGRPNYRPIDDKAEVCPTKATLL